MFNIERWQEIFEAISKNKLRTFLTGLSVGSGIFILIILLGIAEGMKNGINQEFEKDASTLINFWGRQTSKEYMGLGLNRQIKFSQQDYDYVSERYFNDIDHQTARYQNWEVVSNYKDQTGTYPLRGVMPGMQYIENLHLNAGRFITEQDIKNRNKVVAVGYYAAKDLFKDMDYKDAIGEILTIDNINYKVVGIYSDPGGERDESFLYIPNTNMIQLYSDQSNIGSFMFTLKPEDDFETAHDKAVAFEKQFLTYLKKAHLVHPDDEKAVQSNNTLEHAKNSYS